MPLAGGAFVALLLAPTAVAQVAVLVVAALAGQVLSRWLPERAAAAAAPLPLQVSRRVGSACLAVLGALFVVLPLLAAQGVLGQLADAMYRSGALVFGGGHVVLPLLESATVPELVSEPEFLAGYGAAQAVPGPLFTFASYLGQAAAGVPGAVVATVSIFAPGFFVLFGVLPFWERLRRHARVHASLYAVNAAVVGILAAALYDPISTTAIRRPIDLAYAAALFVALHFWKVPPCTLVVAAVAASPLLALQGPLLVLAGCTGPTITP